MQSMKQGATTLLVPYVHSSTSSSPSLSLLVISINGGATKVVAKGTFLINSLAAKILFDLEATHSFIDTSFMSKLGL